MATRLINKTWEVDDVLTNATSAKMSDPTGTYGVKRNDTDAVITADGTDMTSVSTGIYQHSFTDVVDVSYTAYVEIVYDSATYHFEVDLAARRRDLEAKAREFLVPYVTVSASRPGGVHSAFGDAPLGAKACLLSSGVTAR